jgi:hypothetical protein
MSLSGNLGFAFVILFLLLILLFLVLNSKKTFVSLRAIPAFKKLGRAFGISVEAGKRIHLSLGRGSISGEQSAAGMIGLSVLERIIRVAAISDRPPVATSGDPTMAILSQDVAKAANQTMSNSSEEVRLRSRLTGLTPLSYAAGVIPVIYDEQSSIDIILGNFGSEVALIADASERNANVSLAGSDSLPAQAILYTTAREPLIGEEFFASGAYVQAGRVHVASLHAQDVMRWILIISILAGAVFKLLGIL